MIDVTVNSGVLGGGPSPQPGTDLIVEARWGAARAVLRPFDHTIGGKVGGHYRVSLKTAGTSGIGAGGLLFSFRYGDPNTVAMPLEVSVGGIVTTAFTTAQAVDVDMVNVRAWQASDSGGTAIVVNGNSQKNAATGMSPSSFASSGDMRVSSGSALSAGGTKTPDSNANGILALPNTNGLGSGASPLPIYSLTNVGQHPLVYAANEGFNLRVVTAQGAVGVVAYYIELEWVELIGF